MYKDHLQSSTKIRKIEDKGLPAPPGGSSEELQYSSWANLLPPALVHLLFTNSDKPLGLQLHQATLLTLRHTDFTTQDADSAGMQLELLTLKFLVHSCIFFNALCLQIERH